MKIGIDIRAIGRHRTGDETYTLQLVKHLASIDSNNSYFLYTDTNNSEELSKIEKRLNLKNENFSVVSVLPCSKALWTFWSLPRRVRKDKLDVLHVQYITPIKLSTGTKIITTIHDISFVRYPKFISKRDLLFLKLLIPPSLKHADRIIAVSNFTKNEIMEYYRIDKQKIIAIQNGGADNKFFNNLSDEELNAAKQTIGASDPFIFYVGTLQPRKNIPFLLKGFAELKKIYKESSEIQKLSLIIGGTQEGCNYDKNIDDEVAKLPIEVRKKVLFPGFIGENMLRAIFQASRAFCFPSIYEGFGLPVIEAMASGTPVLCSGKSCLGEIAKEAAMIYKDNDLNDFAEKLHLIVTNDELRKKLADKGRRQAKNFSWHQCAEETLRVYETLK